MATSVAPTTATSPKPVATCLADALDSTQVRPSVEDHDAGTKPAALLWGSWWFPTATSRPPNPAIAVGVKRAKSCGDFCQVRPSADVHTDDERVIPSSWAIAAKPPLHEVTAAGMNPDDSGRATWPQG